MNKSPAVIFEHYEPLECCHCGKDLLEAGDGIFALVHKRGDHSKYVDAYWACRRQCDREMKAIYRSQGCLTGWHSIKDLTIPHEYLWWIMSVLKKIEKGRFEQDAFKKTKIFSLKVAQMVMRETTEEERDRLTEVDVMRGVI